MKLQFKRTSNGPDMIAFSPDNAEEEKQLKELQNVLAQYRIKHQTVIKELLVSVVTSPP